MATRIIDAGAGAPTPSQGGTPKAHEYQRGRTLGRSGYLPREFLSTGEALCRLIRAPEVAALQFNEEAPCSSLLALGIARTGGALGIAEMVLETSLSVHVQQALEALRDAVDEARLIFTELQRRDGEQYAGGDEAQGLAGVQS